MVELAAYQRIMAIFSDPVDHREEEFNSWYTGQLVHAILSIPGVRSAQRFVDRDAPAEGGLTPRHKYLAIYEFDCPAVFVVESIRERQRDGRIHVSSALDYQGVDALLLGRADGAALRPDIGTPGAAVTLRGAIHQRRPLDLPSAGGLMAGPLLYRPLGAQLRKAGEGMTLYLFDQRADHNGDVQHADHKLQAAGSPRRYVAMTARLSGPAQAAVTHASLGG